MTDRRNPRPDARTIGFYLPRSTFPADRGQLVCEAHRSGAPEPVVRLLWALAPPPATYLDVEDVLQELSRAEEHLDHVDVAPTPRR